MDERAADERAPGRGRYARAEVERRFLARGELPAGDRVVRVDDLYLDGLRLRLRVMRSGDATVFKLTQKIRDDEADPARVRITTMYLSEGEHARLCLLPGRRLTKTRRLCTYDGAVLAIDEFHGVLRGLVLVEVEVADPAAALPLPPWAGPEVTADDRFSGGRLAAVTDPREVRRLVESVP